MCGEDGVVVVDWVVLMVVFIGFGIVVIGIVWNGVVMSVGNFGI